MTSLKQSQIKQNKKLFLPLNLLFISNKKNQKYLKTRHFPSLLRRRPLGHSTFFGNVGASIKIRLTISNCSLSLFFLQNSHKKALPKLY